MLDFCSSSSPCTPPQHPPTPLSNAKDVHLFQRPAIASHELSRSARKLSSRTRITVERARLGSLCRRRRIHDRSSQYKPQFRHLSSPLRGREEGKNPSPPRMIPAHHIDAYSIQRSSLLPPLPSLPTLPSIEELKAKAGVDAVASKLDEWATALASYRASLNALGVELSRAPGSTYDSILKNRTDTTIHPEVEWDGQVRYGGGLGLNEEAFLRERKRFMVPAFAKMMGVEEKEVDERDIPVIAVAGSGGGYRAMVSTLGSISGAKESGVWDIVSYASAVSGSCWALSLLYSLGGGNIDATIEHVKNRITSPFLHANSLELLTTKPTSEYLLAGAILKESNTAGELSL